MEILIWCRKCGERTMHRAEVTTIQYEVVTVWHCTMCRDKAILDNLRKKLNQKTESK